MKPLQSLSHCEEFFALLSTIYHRCFWLRISIYFNFRSDFRKHVRGDEKSPSGHVSALWKNVCVCICYIQRTYAHLLFICCSCKRQNTSFPYLPVLVRIPSSIMIPFLGLSTAALLIATGWQVRLITAVKTPYLPDGKIDLEAPRPLFVSATRPKLEIRNWPQAHHKRCISILCKGFSQLFCIKMSTPN